LRSTISATVSRNSPAKTAVTGAIRKNKATSKPTLANAAITSSNQGQGNVSKADEPTQIAASKPANSSSVSPMAFHRTDLKAGERTSFAARNAEEIIGVDSSSVQSTDSGGRRR
jgi:hypothetical protein